MTLKWWVAPVANLVGSAVFGLIMMCMFCICGYLMCSRTTAALVLLVSLVVPLMFVLTLRMTWKLWKAKEKGRFAVALALLVLALFPDFMYATAACMVGTKVVGIGREFFADGLELPPDGQYEEMPDTESRTNLVEKADGPQTNVCETSLTVYAFGREHPRCFDAWINPGESGTVILRVNEVTTGKQVIKERTYPFSHKAEGEAKQLLSGNMQTMVPGRGGKPYAARFELWFRASDNAPERLLTSRVYRVSGMAH